MPPAHRISAFPCDECGVDILIDTNCAQCGQPIALTTLQTPKLNGVLLSEFFLKKLPAPTVELPSINYTPPLTIQTLMSGGPSAAGWSMTSGMMECPYKGQLIFHNVKAVSNWNTGDELGRLGFGSLIHALLAVRWVYGQEWALKLLEGYSDLHPTDRMKAEHSLAIYDERWPREKEPFLVLGIECEVFTEIALGVISSVRYDGIVKPFKRNSATGELLIDSTGQWIPDDHVLSLERKTTATGSESTMMSYLGQFYTQVANWNCNKELVAKYGEMRGVLGDMITKHVVPRCERLGPKYISKHQQAFAIDYLKYKTQIRYPLDSEGRLPRMLHACISRYGPCQFFDLCHNDERNNYEAGNQ